MRQNTNKEAIMKFTHRKIAKELLAKYAKEMDIESLSLGGLIESHRRLRSMNIEISEERRRIMDEAYEHGRKEGRKEALVKEYVSLERLSEMTLSEIVGLLMRD